MTTNSPSFPLAGKSILLAGASGGLGTALAIELAKRQANLTLAARNNDWLG